MYFGYFINNLLMIVLFFWYSGKLFEQVKLRKLDYLLLPILIVFNSLINTDATFQVSLFITILTYFIISGIYYQGSSVKKILSICFYLIFSYISEISAYVFLSQLSPFYDIQVNTIPYILLENGIRATIFFPIIYLIIKINGLRDMIDTKKIWYFVTFPIISIIIIFFIMDSNVIQIEPSLYTFILIGLITFNVVLCKGFSDIIKSKNIEIENEKLKSKELHYLLMEEKIDNSRRFIHDFKKHINILSGYVNYQEYERMKTYLYELSEEIKADEKFVVSGNLLIDLALQANKKKIVENSIDIKCDIQVRNLYPLSDYDFNIVFSNILDNALESCLRTKGHFIKIKVNKIDGLIILKVANPCFEMNKDLVTLKGDKDEHGNGIRNVEKIVKKYNGISSFEFDEKNKIFVTTVIFECKGDACYHLDK